MTSYTGPNWKYTGPTGPALPLKESERLQVVTDAIREDNLRGEVAKAREAVSEAIRLSGAGQSESDEARASAMNLHANMAQIAQVLGTLTELSFLMPESCNAAIREASLALHAGFENHFELQKRINYAAAQHYNARMQAYEARHFLRDAERFITR